MEMKNGMLICTQSLACIFNFQHLIPVNCEVSREVDGKVFFRMGGVLRREEEEKINNPNLCLPI